MFRACVLFLCSALLSCPTYATGIPHPPNCDIKGNVNGSKRLYFLPGLPGYEDVRINRKGERWFCSEDEALAAGWKPAGAITGRIGQTTPKSNCQIAADAPSVQCAIKGNISKRGRIYHMPCSRSYAVTEIRIEDGERWFCSEEEALQSGWRAPRN
jgi:hypothetical protein